MCGSEQSSYLRRRTTHTFNSRVSSCWCRYCRREGRKKNRKTRTETFKWKFQQQLKRGKKLLIQICFIRKKSSKGGWRDEEKWENIYVGSASIIPPCSHTKAPSNESIKLLGETTTEPRFLFIEKKGKFRNCRRKAFSFPKLFLSLLCLSEFLENFYLKLLSLCACWLAVEGIIQEFYGWKFKFHSSLIIHLSFSYLITFIQKFNSFYSLSVSRKPVACRGCRNWTRFQQRINHWHSWGCRDANIWVMGGVEIVCSFFLFLLF